MVACIYMSHPKGFNIVDNKIQLIKIVSLHKALEDNLYNV